MSKVHVCSTLPTLSFARDNNDEAEPETLRSKRVLDVLKLSHSQVHRQIELVTGQTIQGVKRILETCPREMLPFRIVARPRLYIAISTYLSSPRSSTRGNNAPEGIGIAGSVSATPRACSRWEGKQWSVDRREAAIDRSRLINSRKRTTAMNNCDR